MKRNIMLALAISPLLLGAGCEEVEPDLLLDLPRRVPDPPIEWDDVPRWSATRNEDVRVFGYDDGFYARRKGNTRARRSRFYRRGRREGREDRFFGRRSRIIESYGF